MRRNAALPLITTLIIVAIPLAVAFLQNPIFSHAAPVATGSGCVQQATTQAQQEGIKLPFNGFPTASSVNSKSTTGTWTSTWGVDSSNGGDWGWDNMSTTCDSAVSGDSVLQVHYAAHSSSPSCSCAQGGGQFYAFFNKSSLMSSLSSASTLYLQYYVKFPQNFDFGTGAKLPGFFGGTNKGISGGNHSTEAWSTRLMWRTDPKGAQGEVYVYSPGQSSGYGSDLGLGKWTFQADGQWHPIEQEIQNSTQGATSTIWYDGKQVFTSRINTTGIPTVGIFFSTFFGGHDASWGPNQSENMYFADFQVGTQYISPDTTEVHGLTTYTALLPTSTSATLTPRSTSAALTLTSTSTASCLATPTPSVTTASPTPCLQGNAVSVGIQGYGYPDNNNGVPGHNDTAAIAYPKSEGYATLHNQATEGTGTYADPITFAAYTPLTTGKQAVFAPGTRIYVPYLRKYFILEDSCGDCNQTLNGNSYLLHLWLGPSSLTTQDTAQSIEACEQKIAQTTTQIFINPSSSADYPVEQTPLYSNGNCSAKTFTTSSPDATPTVTPTASDATPVITPTIAPTATPTTASTPTPTIAPTTHSTSSGGPASDGKTMTVAVTSFGYPDNDDGNGHFGTAVIAFPKSDGYPTVHNIATEGTGTYADPITFAAYIPDTEGNNAAFPPGMRIYVPYLRKYFMLEDQCADCNQGTHGNAYHIDLWMGPDTSAAMQYAQSIQDCEGSITYDSKQIIMDPTADHVVDTTPLYSNGSCSARQYSS